jgi:hypothetical protein
MDTPPLADSIECGVRWALFPITLAAWSIFFGLIVALYVSTSFLPVALLGYGLTSTTSATVAMIALPVIILLLIVPIGMLAVKYDAGYPKLTVNIDFKEYDASSRRSD